jgi:argininosuccinate lyase
VSASRAPARRLPRLNASIGFDWRLGPYDIAQSPGARAHARGPGHHRASDRDDARGLDEVGSELDEGRFAVRDDDEDIHMAIERR